MKTRKDHWQKIYRTRDHNKVGWYQETPQVSLQLLAEINARPSESIIDVGCGASALVDHLIDQGYINITLLDLSEEALSATKLRLGNKGHLPEFICGDITDITFKHSFDIWHDRAVFHFLTKARDRKAYMAALEQSLSISGRAIIGTFSLDGPATCSGLDVMRYDEEKLRHELPSEFELLNSVASSHLTPGGTIQEYMYFIIRHKKAG